MSPVTPGPSKSCEDDDSQKEDDNDGESDSGSINLDFDAEIRDVLDSLDSEQLDKFLEPLEEGEITENSDNDCDSDDSEKTVILPLEKQYNRKLVPSDLPFEDNQEPPVQINTPTSAANLFSRRSAVTSPNTQVTENAESLKDPIPSCSSFDPSKFIVTVPADPSPSTANHGATSGASSLPSESEPLVDEEKRQALQEKILKILNASSKPTISTNQKPIALVSPQVNQENFPPPPSIGPITTPYFKNAERGESAGTVQLENANCETSSPRNKSSDREATVIEKPKKPSKSNKTSSELPKIICPAVEEFSVEEEASVEKDESCSTSDKKSNDESKACFSRASKKLSAVSSASGCEPNFDSSNISEKTARDLLVVMSQCHEFFQPEEFKKLIKPQESLLRSVLEAQKNQVINLESSLIKKINMFLRYGQKSDDEGKKKKKKKKKEKDKSKPVKSQVIIPNKEPKNQSIDVEGGSSSSLSEISPKRIPSRSTTLESTHSRSRKSRSRSLSRSKSKSRSLSPRNHHSTYRKRYRSPSPKRRNHFHPRHRRSRTRSRSRSISPFPLSKSRRRSHSRSLSRSPVRRSPPRNSRRDFYTSKRSPDRNRTSRPLRRRSLSPLSPPNRCGNRQSSPVSRPISPLRKSSMKILSTEYREELKKRNEDAVKNLREVVEPSLVSNPSTSGTHEITIPRNPNASFLPANINEFNVPSRATVENQCASFSGDVQYPYNQPFPEERRFEQPQPLYVDPALAVMHPGSHDSFQNSYIAHNPVPELNGYSYPMRPPVQTRTPDYPLPLPPPPPPGMLLGVGQSLISNDPAYNTMYSHESVPLATSNCIPQPPLQSIPLPVAPVVAPLPGCHPPQPVPAPVPQNVPQTLPSVEPLLPPSANYYDPLAPDEGSAEVQVSNKRVSFTEVRVTNSGVSFSQVHVTNNSVTLSGGSLLRNSNSSASVGGQQNDPAARRPSVSNCDGDENVSVTPNVSLASKPKTPIKINIRHNQKQTPVVGNDADPDYVEVLELPPKPPPTVVTLDDEEDKAENRVSSRPSSSPLVVKSVDDINKSLSSAKKTAYSPKPIATLENRQRVERMCKEPAKPKGSGSTTSNPNLIIPASVPPNRGTSTPLEPSTSSFISKSKTVIGDAKQQSERSTINTKKTSTSNVSQKVTGIKVSASAASSSPSRKNQLPAKNLKPNAISTVNVSTVPNAKSTKGNSVKQTDKEQNNQSNQAKGRLSNKQDHQAEHVDKNNLSSEKTGGDLPGCSIKGPKQMSSVKKTSQSSNMLAKSQTHTNILSESLQVENGPIDQSDAIARTDSITLHYSEEIQIIEQSENLLTSAVARCTEDSPAKANISESDISTMNVPKSEVETNNSYLSSNVQPEKHSDDQSVDQPCKELGAQKDKETNNGVPKSSSANQNEQKSSQENSSKPKSKQTSMISKNSSNVDSSLSGKNSGKAMVENAGAITTVSKKSCQVPVNNAINVNSEKSTKETTECRKGLDSQHQSEKDIEEGINRNKVTPENIDKCPSKSLEESIATSKNSVSAPLISKSSTLTSVSSESTETSKVKTSSSESSKDSTNDESAKAGNNARFMTLQKLLSQIESVKQSVAQGITASPEESINSPLDKATEVSVAGASSDTNNKSSESMTGESSSLKSSKNSSVQETTGDDKESKNTGEGGASLYELSKYSSAKENTDLSKETKQKSSSSVTSEASVVKMSSDNSQQSLSKKKTSTSKSVKGVEPQTKAVSSDNSVTMSKNSKNSLKDGRPLHKLSEDSSAQENSCLSQELKNSHKDKSLPLVSSKGSVAAVQRRVSKEPENSQKDESSSLKSSKVCLGQENTDLSKDAKDSQKDKVSVDSSCTGKELKDSVEGKSPPHKSSKDSVAQENTDSNKESKGSHKDKSKSAPPVSSGSLLSVESSQANKEPKDFSKNKTVSQKLAKDSSAQGIEDLRKESKDYQRTESSSAMSCEGSVSKEKSCASKELKDLHTGETSSHSSKNSPAQENNLVQESKDLLKTKSSVAVSSKSSTSDSFAEETSVSKGTKNSLKDKFSTSHENSVGPKISHANEVAKSSQEENLPKTLDPQIRDDSSKQYKISSKNKVSASKSSEDGESQKSADSNEDSKRLQKDKVSKLKPSSVGSQENGSGKSKNPQKEKVLPQKLDKNSVPQKSTDMSKESKKLVKDKASSSNPSKVSVDSKGLTPVGSEIHSPSENFKKDASNSAFFKIKMPPGVRLNKQPEVKLERLRLSDLGKRDRKFLRRCRLEAKSNNSETSKAAKKEHSSKLDSDLDETSSKKTSKNPVKHRSFELDSDSDETLKNVTPKVSAKYQASKLDSNIARSSNNVTSKTSVKRRFPESDSDSDESVNKKASKLSVKRRVSATTVKRCVSESDSDSSEVEDKDASKVSIKCRVLTSDSDSDESSDEEASKVPVRGLVSDDSNLDRTLNSKSSKSLPKSHSSELNHDSDSAENNESSKVTANLESATTPDDEPIKPLSKRRASRIESDSDVTPGNSPIKAAPSKRRLSVLSSDSDEESNKSSKAPLQRLIAELSSDSDDVSDGKTSKGPKRRLSESSKGSDKTDVNIRKRKKSDLAPKKDKESKKEKEEAQHKMVQEKLIPNKPKLGSFRIPKLSSKNKAPSGILKSSNDDEKRSILNDRNISTLPSFERPKENVHKPVLKGLRHRHLNRSDDSSNKSVPPDPSAGSTGSLIKERRLSADNQLKENWSFDKSDKFSSKTLTDETKTSVKTTSKENVLYPIENLKGSGKSVPHDEESIERGSSEVSSEHISETSKGENESSDVTKSFELDSVKNVKGNEKSVSCDKESHSKGNLEVSSEIISETSNQEAESSKLKETSECSAAEKLKRNEKSVSCHGDLLPREGSEVTSKNIGGIPNKENENSGRPEKSELSKKSLINDKKSLSELKLPVVEVEDAVSSLAKKLVPIDSSVTDANQDNSVRISEDYIIDVPINEVEPTSKTDKVAPASKPQRRPSLNTRIAQQIERKKRRKLVQNEQLKKKISSLEHKNLFLQAKVVHYKHNARGFKERYLNLKKQKQKPSSHTKSVQCCVSDSSTASEILASTSTSAATASSGSPSSTIQKQTSGSKNSLLKPGSKGDEGLSYKAKRGKKLWTYLQSQNCKKTVSCQTSGPKLEWKLVNTNNAIIISSSEMNIPYVTSALLSYKQEALDK